MMKVMILKITVELYPPQGAKKRMTNNRIGNYNGTVWRGKKVRNNMRQTSLGEKLCITVLGSRTVDKTV